MFGNFPGLPDFSKIQPMLEQALDTFQKMQADIEEIKQIQARLERLIGPLEDVEGDE